MSSAICLSVLTPLLISSSCVSCGRRGGGAVSPGGARGGARSGRGERARAGGWGWRSAPAASWRPATPPRRRRTPRSAPCCTPGSCRGCSGLRGPGQGRREGELLSAGTVPFPAASGAPPTPRPALGARDSRVRARRRARQRREGRAPNLISTGARFARSCRLSLRFLFPPSLPSGIASIPLWMRSTSAARFSLISGVSFFVFCCGGPACWGTGHHKMHPENGSPDSTH